MWIFCGCTVLSSLGMEVTCLSLVFRLTETTHSGKMWEAESSLSASSRSLALTRSQEPIYTEDLMVSLLLSASGRGCSWSQEWRELSSSSNLDFMWGKTYYRYLEWGSSGWRLPDPADSLGQ